MAIETINKAEALMSYEREAEIKKVFAQMALVAHHVEANGDQGYEGVIILGED